MSEADQTLDDVFEDVEESTDVKETPEPAAVETPEPEKDVKDKGSPSDPDAKIPLAGLLDEREKRQKAEARLAELERQMAKPAAKRPSVFDDEEGAFSEIRNEFKTEMTRMRFDLSREMMMSKDDFEKRENEFLELAASDDALRQKLLSHPNPAKFAYDTAVKAERARQLDGVDDLDGKLKRLAELEERFKNEQEAEEREEKTANKRKAMTPSLATQRSSKQTRESLEDESLTDVIGD